MNSILDLINSHLLDLLRALDGNDVPLIVGGGYGLYLRTRMWRESGEMALIAGLTSARTTNDIDLFLRTEIITDSARRDVFKAALDQLGYHVVDTAKYWQFVKSVPGFEHGLKIDSLTGPPDPVIDQSEYRIDARRLMPKQHGANLHARVTPEAVGLHDHALSFTLDGNTSDGQEYRGVVYLPQTLTYVNMKLIAFRDYERRSQDRMSPEEKRQSERLYARKHAGDIFTILATTTDSEWEAAKRLSEQASNEPMLQEAREVITGYFGDAAAIGCLRIREQEAALNAKDLANIVSILRELYNIAPIV